MKKMTRIFALLLVIATLMGVVAGCKKDSADATGTTGTAGEAGTYTVSVKNAAGLPMEGITVYIYADTGLTDMKNYGTTDANGQATLQMEGE